MINALTTTQTAETTAANTPQKAKISSDFETFLRMLTVQMRNQDPLNPVEGADYAVQLATFSGVEQQVKTNDLLGALSQGLQPGNIASLASWIGREVPAPGPITYNGTPLTIETQPPSEGGRSLIEVQSASGTVIDHIEISAGQTRLNWPQNSASSPPIGRYSFRAITLSADGTPQTQGDAQVFQKVVEVTADDSGGQLKLASGTSLAANDVRSLRAAP